MVTLLLLLSMMHAFAAPPPLPGTLEDQVVALASPDPDQRQAAREQLLELEVRDLPGLADVAKRVAPLFPGQRDVLREVARQAHAAANLELPRGTGGFLGVRLSPINNFPLEQNDGALVYDTVVGNVAATRLRPGDLIVAVGPAPGRPIHNSNTLMNVIAAYDPGDTITLHVNRGGVVRAVDFQLDVHPDNFIVLGLDPELLRARGQAEGDRWFDRNILPLCLRPQVIETPAGTAEDVGNGRNSG